MLEPRHAYLAALVIGVGTLALGVAGGLVESARTGGWRPGLHLNYGLEIAELERAGRHEQAVERMRTAAAIEFNRVSLLRALLDDARRMQDAERELEALRALARYDSRDPAVLDEIGKLLVRRANLARQQGGALDAAAAREAIAWSNRLVEVAPDSVWGHTNLGAAWWTLGDAERARAHLAEALRIDPGFTMARDLLARMSAKEGG